MLRHENTIPEILLTLFAPPLNPTILFARVNMETAINAKAKMARKIPGYP